MNLILSNVGVGSWVLLGVLLLILIVSPFLMRAKNKKEMDSQQKMMNAIKKGDTVLTSAGVIGKVVGIDNNKQGYKTLTIETGDEKHKGYLCVDIRSIYYNLSNPVVENVETKPTKTESHDDTKPDKVEDVIEMPQDVPHDKENVVENAENNPTETAKVAETKNSKSKKK